MRQGRLILSVLAGLLVGLASAAATAAEVDVVVQCATEQNSETTMSVVILYGNLSCRAEPVRTMSSIVGNADQTLGGIGVFGPVVIFEGMVAAGTGGTHCGCSGSQCQCSGNSCSTDSDCPLCVASTPTVSNVLRDALPEIPAVLDGAVATYLFITETGEGAEMDTELNECFVEVL